MWAGSPSLIVVVFALVCVAQQRPPCQNSGEDKMKNFVEKLNNRTKIYTDLSEFLTNLFPKNETCSLCVSLTLTTGSASQYVQGCGEGICEGSGKIFTGSSSDGSADQLRSFSLICGPTPRIVADKTLNVLSSPSRLQTEKTSEMNGTQHYILFITVMSFFLFLLRVY